MTEWTWSSADAARAYLADLGRLWGVWVLVLGAMFTTSGALLIVVSFAAFLVLVGLSMPVQKHVDAVEAPADTRSRMAQIRGGSERDHAARQLLYAKGPVRAAAEATGAGPAWVWARHAIVAGTVGAFAWVVIFG